METKKKRVIALGFFDGIHLGHQALIAKVKEVSEKTGLSPAVVTFDTHPDNLVRGEKTELIYSADDRRDIVRRLFGIHEMIFLHFDREMMEMSWQDFLTWVCENFGAVHFVAGYDFHFGAQGQGNAEKLRSFCREKGLGCDIIPEVDLEGIRVSSTYIRSLLQDGKLLTANRYLGHRYFLRGKVRTGFRLGRKLGAPTINMRFEENVMVPMKGVYAAKATLEDGSRYLAVTNIGVRPTVSGTADVSVESNLLDYSGDLYGTNVLVEFYKFLRPEVRFHDTEELRQQILKDTQETRDFFAEFES